MTNIIFATVILTAMLTCVACYVVHNNFFKKAGNIIDYGKGSFEVMYDFDGACLVIEVGHNKYFYKTDKAFLLNWDSVMKNVIIDKCNIQEIYNIVCVSLADEIVKRSDRKCL